MCVCVYTESERESTVGLNINSSHSRFVLPFAKEMDPGGLEQLRHGSDFLFLKCMRETALKRETSRVLFKAL